MQYYILYLRLYKLCKILIPDTKYLNTDNITGNIL